MKLKHIFTPIIAICMLTGCASLNAPVSEFKFNQNPLQEDGEEESTDKLEIFAPDFQSEGDSCLIKYGEKTILIDAGPTTDDEGKFYDMIKDVKTLNYVIITHQDRDHVSQIAKDHGGLRTWLEEEGHTIEYLIDSDVTKDETSDSKKQLSTFVGGHYSGLFTSYQSYRDELITKGVIEYYYPASQCTYKQDGLKLNKELKNSIKENNNNNGNAVEKLSDTFYVDDNKSLELKILYNYYGSHKLGTSDSDKVFNSMCVCVLLTLNSRDKFLFTGDLVEFNSTGGSKDNDNIPIASHLGPEYRLIQDNYDDLKDGVLFYKGGHHGSQYSNSEYFIDTIRPQHVVIQGHNDEEGYQFPKQLTLNHLTRWTDRIYVTSYNSYTISDDGENLIYQNNKICGDIHLVYDENADGKLYLIDNWNYSILNSSMMSRDRAFVFGTYVLNCDTNPNSHVNATYLKLGHIDILIGMGYSSYASARAKEYNQLLNKIKYLCNDGVIDYLIVPSIKQDYFGFLIENKDTYKGLLNEEDIKVNYVIRHAISGSDPMINKFFETLDDKQINVLKSDFLDGRSVNLGSLTSNKFYLKVLRQSANSVKQGDLNDNSIATYLYADGYGYLNLGSASSYTFADELLNNNEHIKEKVNVFELPQNGRWPGDEKIDTIKNFVKAIKANQFVAVSNAYMNSPIHQNGIVSQYKAIIGTKNLILAKYSNDEGMMEANYNKKTADSSDIFVRGYIGISIDTKLSTKSDFNKLKKAKRIRIQVRYNSYSAETDVMSLGEDEITLHIPVLSFSTYSLPKLSDIEKSNIIN